MNQIQTLRVLWAALMGSVGLIAVVTVILPPSPAEPQSVHLIVFAAASLGIAVASFVLPRQIHRNGARGAQAEIVEIPDPDAPSGFGNAKRVRTFKDARRARSLAMMSYQQYTILGCALSESVGLFGFVLDRLGHPQVASAPFLMASLLLMALRFPSEARAVALFEGATNARLT